MKRADPAFMVALLAITAECTVSGNFLTWIGSSYVSEGGWPIAKIHPGSYLAGAALLARVSRPRHQIVEPWHVAARTPNLAMFLILMAAATLYAAALTGTGGLITLFDTFAPAGMIAAVLVDATPRQLTILRRLLQFLFLINATIALGETATDIHLIPLPAERPELPTEFRPTALYDHPLTGAAATMLGLLVRGKNPGNAIGRTMYQAWLFAALLAFGGRTALALSVLAVVALGCQTAWISLIRQRVRPTHALPAIATALGLLTAAILALTLGVAPRLVAHLSWDNSAQARLSQFHLLGLLRLDQLIFGCRRADLIALIEPLRLAYSVDVIENFWLLMFVSLGALGFPIFVLGFLIFMQFLWRAGDRQAKWMVILLLISASGSNSLGRKSTLLTTLVACVSCSGAGWRPLRAVVSPVLIQPSPSLAS